MIKHTTLALALLLAASASDPHAARAENSTYLNPASTCASAYGEDQVVYWDDGGVYNASSTWWRTMVCPLRATADHRIEQVAVSAYDRNYSLDVNCRVILTNNNTGLTTWATAFTSSGSDTKPAWISLGGVTVFDRVANILCYVPQTYQGNRSGVLSYVYSSRIPTW